MCSFCRINLGSNLSDSVDRRFCAVLVESSVVFTATSPRVCFIFWAWSYTATCHDDSIRIRLWLSGVCHPNTVEKSTCLTWQHTFHPCFVFRGELLQLLLMRRAFPRIKLVLILGEGVLIWFRVRHSFVKKKCEIETESVPFSTCSLKAKWDGF